MDLNELAVRVVASLLVERGLCRSRADDGICGLSEDGAAAAGGDDDGVGGKGANLHGAQIHGADAASNTLSIKNGGEKFPMLVLLHLAFGFVAPNLLVECVQELLSGGRSGKRGAVIERASEAAKIKKTFGSAIEGNTHAVEQINEARSSFAHGLDRRLVGKKVSTVDGVVEVLVGGIALALQVFGGVDAPLGADRVGALYRDDREQVNFSAHLGDLDHGGEAGEAAAHYDNLRSCHYLRIRSSGLEPFRAKARVVVASLRHVFRNL